MTLVRRANWPSDPFFEMDRLFNRAFGSGDFWPEAFRPSAERDFPLDVYGDDEHYYVVAEVPGVKKDDVDLNVQNSVLTIAVSRKFEGEGNSGERSLTRSITVGDDIDVEGVTARLENGLLTVTLPKAEERRPRKIAIK